MLEEEGRTPFIMGTMEGSRPDSKNIFFYGHIDKQPHLLPWGEGLSPVEPVLREGKLYGRGSSDDGYAPFASAVIMRLL
jgi:acetylornithine deacetylase/succinyl-diaminopimelate desuccinylase-like protein